MIQCSDQCHSSCMMYCLNAVMKAEAPQRRGTAPQRHGTKTDQHSSIIMHGHLTATAHLRRGRRGRAGRGPVAAGPSSTLRKRQNRCRLKHPGYQDSAPKHH
jgi:hypothetical protein